MKFNLNESCTYVISKLDDGYIIKNNLGYIMGAEQMIEVSFGLIGCAIKYKNEIDVYNKKNELEVERTLRGYDQTKKKETNKSGYVYLFECGNKYKIGYSKNVERRLKDLDYRPFKINLLAKSPLLKNAYDNEQYIHFNLNKYKNIGEWYVFDEDKLDEVIRVIENLYDEE